VRFGPTKNQNTTHEKGVISHHEKQKEQWTCETLLFRYTNDLVVLLRLTSAENQIIHHETIMLENVLGRTNDVVRARAGVWWSRGGRFLPDEQQTESLFLQTRGVVGEDFFGHPTMTTSQPATRTINDNHLS
jgi:hypothetical protein